MASKSQVHTLHHLIFPSRLLYPPPPFFFPSFPSTLSLPFFHNRVEQLSSRALPQLCHILGRSLGIRLDLCSCVYLTYTQFYMHTAISTFCMVPCVNHIAPFILFIGLTLFPLLPSLPAVLKHGEPQSGIHGLHVRGRRHGVHGIPQCQTSAPTLQIEEAALKTP